MDSSVSRNSIAESAVRERIYWKIGILKTEQQPTQLRRKIFSSIASSLLYVQLKRNDEAIGLSSREQATSQDE